MIMKNINDFKRFKMNEEISDELKQRATDAMKERGWHSRANKLLDPYIESLDEFIDRGLLLFNEKDTNIFFKIKSFKFEYNKLYINLAADSSYELQLPGFTHKTYKQNIIYDPKNDSLKGQYIPDQITCDRKTARLLGKIAQKINKNTKYKNGVGDLKIKGWE